MDDLLVEFVVEFCEMFEVLGGEIVVWEVDLLDCVWFDLIFCFVYMVKGNCGFFDFLCLQLLSYVVEDVFVDVCVDCCCVDVVLVDVVFVIVDCISDMIDVIDCGEDIFEGGDDGLIVVFQFDGDVGEVFVVLLVV